MFSSVTEVFPRHTDDSTSDDSSEETIIIIDDGIPDILPKHTDIVLTQPSENNFQKSNDGFYPLEDARKTCIDFATNTVTIQNIENSDEICVEETIVIEDARRKENCNANELRLENKSWLPLNEQKKPLDTSRYSLNDNEVVLACDDVNTTKSSDDDVIFVTTYTATTTTTMTAALSDLRAISSTTASTVSSPSPPKLRRKRKNKTPVIPRRNPRRVAQMEKASVQLAMKLSISKRIFGCRTKSSTEVVRNYRQSCRTTGAILSPPRELQNRDWKDWPSEGLHEKPFYNPDTKRLHRFDKNPTFINKVENNNEYISESRKVIPEKSELDTDLVTLTHQSLHLVLGYVADVKKYNQVKEKAKKQYLGNFWNLCSNGIRSNVQDACEVLLDTCKLYCLCNGVTKEDLVRYINSLSGCDLDSVA